MNTRTYLSHPQFAHLLKCPRQFHYHYVLGLRPPSKRNLLLGNAGHSACEAHYTRMMATC